MFNTNLVMRIDASVDLLSRRLSWAYRTAAIRIVVAMASFLLLSDSALANDNIANERPPVDTNALEKHWKVDCTQLKMQLISASTQDSVPEWRSIDVDQLQEQLLLCGIIHERFATDDEKACNVFSLALDGYRAIPRGRVDKISENDRRMIAKKIGCATKSLQ